MPGEDITHICGVNDCRLPVGHAGGHNPYPTRAWGFMGKNDKNKLTKAGFATPRGGAKGAYQNHVLRSNRVIIPYEFFDPATAGVYANGYVVRLFPEQYFTAAGQPKPEFLTPQATVVVGQNAFVLYRTYAAFKILPPLEEWEVRGMKVDGKVVKKRCADGCDTGHYVLRLPTAGAKKKRKNKGLPQGIFAPEYTSVDTNYLCRCVLAWLTLHTVNSPYTTSQAGHLKAILENEGLLDEAQWEYNGVLRHGLTTCPLCSRFIEYEELHTMLELEEEQALVNAAIQVAGATRSTIVNLFHLYPLRYGASEHAPQKVAWGHAICNTKLGQRRCHPLQELMDTGLKVGVIKPQGIETFGWISQDWEMIRSPRGAVWIRLCEDGDHLDQADGLDDAAVEGDVLASGDAEGAQ